MQFLSLVTAARLGRASVKQLSSHTCDLRKILPDSFIIPQDVACPSLYSPNIARLVRVRLQDFVTVCVRAHRAPGPA